MRNFGTLRVEINAKCKIKWEASLPNIISFAKLYLSGLREVKLRKAYNRVADSNFLIVNFALKNDLREETVFYLILQRY